MLQNPESPNPHLPNPWLGSTSPALTSFSTLVWPPPPPVDGACGWGVGRLLGCRLLTSMACGFGRGGLVASYLR